MRVTIPDDLADKYAAYAHTQGRSVEAVLCAQLDRFAKLEPGKKAILIQADVLKALETRLGGYALKDGADLLARIEKLADVKFEGVSLGLSTQQLAELQHRAERTGKPVATLVHDVWLYLAQNLFWHSGGGEAKAPAAKAS